MGKKVRQKLRKTFSSRSFIIAVAFLVMSAVLVGRLFDLQVVNGQKYADNFTVKTTRTRSIESTRGNIYDVNGKLLAYNKLSNSVTLEDSGTYDSTRIKNLSLNAEIYQLTNLIQEKGDSLAHDFHIIVDEDGNYAYDVDEGTSRNRFRADVYGEKYVDDLTKAQKNATADELIQFLSEEFGIINKKNPYTDQERKQYNLPDSFTKEETLNIIVVRYQLNLISYQRYVPVTVAEDVSDETVAAVEEIKDTMQGVDITEGYKRVYNNAEAFAPVIGYTGKPSSEELSELQKENDKYDSNSIVGKSGIEQYMETTLQGTDGSENITVDNVGKLLAVDESSHVDPVPGNDVYLTLDSELQVVAYHVLEQRIAGIILNKLANTKYGPSSVSDADKELYIPIYDVYNAIIGNNMVDISHFSAEDASDTEKSVYTAFTAKQTSVMAWIAQELEGNGTKYADLTAEQKSYLSYIYSTYLLSDTGIIDRDAVDREDETYQAYFSDGSISFRQFLQYAIQKNWVDVQKFTTQDGYMDSDEIFSAIVQNLQENLPQKSAFSRIIYKYMLLNDELSPKDLCMILYDQGVLDKEDGTYENFAAGSIAPYDLMVQKITSLEITPAMLALDPCSGSIVINDPDTGEVRACVTYPGYDNNRLSNEMDTTYYNKLYNDLSTPFYNKATQQLTAPGSTFKPLMAVAGLNEGVINQGTYINCTGLFGEGFLDVGDQIHCWLRTGHGPQNVVTAIENSCNVFFCTVGYYLGKEGSDKYSGDRALGKIREYASMFSLDKGTNIQITESDPHVSDAMALPSSIGQGTHQYTTSQLSRYAATIANSGTSYELNLLSKTTDSSGTVLQQFSPKIASTMNISDSIWDAVKNGMRGAMQSHVQVSGLPIEIYGKTGTAQEANNRSSHSIVIGYSHDDAADDIAFAVRIAHGYGSSNALLVLNDVLSYYYGLKDEAQVVTGKAAGEGITTESATD